MTITQLLKRGNAITHQSHSIQEWGGTEDGGNGGSTQVGGKGEGEEEGSLKEGDEREGKEGEKERSEENRRCGVPRLMITDCKYQIRTTMSLQATHISCTHVEIKRSVFRQQILSHGMQGLHCIQAFKLHSKICVTPMYL